MLVYMDDEGFDEGHIKAPILRPFLMYTTALAAVMQFFPEAMASGHKDTGCSRPTKFADDFIASDIRHYKIMVYAILPVDGESYKIVEHLREV